MRKILVFVLSILILQANGFCGIIKVDAGTEIFFKPVDEIVFKDLYEGKEITFEITRDLVVSGVKVLKKGDLFKGEILGGTHIF